MVVKCGVESVNITWKYSESVHVGYELLIRNAIRVH